MNGPGLGYPQHNPQMMPMQQQQGFGMPYALPPNATNWGAHQMPAPISQQQQGYPPMLMGQPGSMNGQVRPPGRGQKQIQQQQTMLPPIPSMMMQQQPQMPMQNWGYPQPGNTMIQPAGRPMMQPAMQQPMYDANYGVRPQAPRQKSAYNSGYQPSFGGGQQMYVPAPNAGPSQYIQRPPLQQQFAPSPQSYQPVPPAYGVPGTVSPRGLQGPPMMPSGQDYDQQYQQQSIPLQRSGSATSFASSRPGSASSVRSRKESKVNKGNRFGEPAIDKSGRRTPIDVRDTLTTRERYAKESKGSLANLDYDSYNLEDWRQLKGRDSHMKLPAGLGHTETEEWKGKVAFSIDI